MTDTDKLSDTIKRSILENDISGLAELRSVKITVTQLQVTNDRVDSYDGYISLLCGAAQIYDTQFSIRIKSK